MYLGKLERSLAAWKFHADVGNRCSVAMFRNEINHKGGVSPSIPDLHGLEREAVVRETQV